MQYSNQYVDKIVDYKKKIDMLLELDASQYCNLGIDSTKQQKEQVKKNSRYIYKAIAKLNSSMGKRFLYHQDK
jgi:hypothetical protein